MIHQLKINKNYFEDVVSGNKTFEIRKNDRDFRVGDFLGLNEVEDEIQFNEVKETGRFALFLIIYVLDDPEYMKEGYVALGIAPCGIHIHKPGSSSNVYGRIDVRQVEHHGLEKL